MRGQIREERLLEGQDMGQVRGHGQEREQCEAGLQGWAGWAEVPHSCPMPGFGTCVGKRP